MKRCEGKNHGDDEPKGQQTKVAVSSLFRNVAVDDNEFFVGLREEGVEE
jgi:hypothetical protein